jgi:SAM-dependent methyltransferase
MEKSNPHSLVDEYRTQVDWRNWPRYLEKLPLLNNQSILDIGCGIGDVCHLLAARVGNVLGVDSNAVLIDSARENAPANCQFIEGNAARITDLGLPRVDGIWSSFLPAYFPNLSLALESWSQNLVSGGWIALVEVDEMLIGHAPLEPDVRDDLSQFSEKLHEAGHYDFGMGSRLVGFMREAGLKVVAEYDFEDPELAFQGPANPEVIEAWRRRFSRLKGLRKFLGKPRFAIVEEAFIDCLRAPDHYSSARVVMVVAQLEKQF